MPSVAMDRFEDSYPEDEDPRYEEWVCTKCKGRFIDIEVYPFAWKHASDDVQLEPQMFWLGITEPLCSTCAALAGIPPIDKE